MKSQRDLRIDSLRGLALCILAIAHLDFPSMRWIWDVAGHTSGAELFVFLSGIVSGLVYGRMARRAPRRQVWARALARARLIYLTYLGLALYIAAYTHLLRAFGVDFAPWGGEQLVRQPWRGLALSLFFLYQPGFSNILPMYCVFVALMPLALRGLQGGRARLVLGISAGLWLGAQFGLNGAVFGPLVAMVGTPTTSVFNLFAWQLLFVAGLWFGVRRADENPVQLPEARWITWVLVPLLLCSFAIRHGIYFDDAVREAVYGLARRRSLYPLRLASFAALAYVVARIGTLRPGWLEWRWLAYLGQHSLQVFAYSVAADYAAQSLKDSSTLVQVVTALFVLASLTVPAWLHVRYRESRRGRPAAVQAVEGAG